MTVRLGELIRLIGEAERELTYRTVSETPAAVSPLMGGDVPIAGWSPSTASSAHTEYSSASWDHMTTCN